MGKPVRLTSKPQTKTAGLKAALAARGLAPRKSLGQNFMLDSNFAAFVARAAAPDERTLVIEVGPGTGLLTAALLQARPAARVLGIEIDWGLAALLRETMSREIASGRLTLLEGDALSGKHALSPSLVQAALEISSREGRPRRVLCSNLPYNAATPFLMNLASDSGPMKIESAVATVQAELAERLLAQPGDSAYGAPTVILALRATGKILRRVGKEIFWPRPQVDSAVVGLELKPWADDAGSEDAAALLRREEVEPFQKFLQWHFSQRRKMLRATFKAREILEALNIPANARAEELAPETLLALFRLATAHE
jgi:16S rRNA (adenine1518-N6/adenine1519-N6)-dimethyltransferase